MALPIIATGRWVELSNTKFRDFATTENIPSSLIDGGDTGRSSIFTAWNSGLMDRGRQRWVTLRAGGHNDTAQNGVYAFRLSDLSWITLRPTNTSRALNYGDPGYPPLAGGSLAETNNLLSPSKIRVYSIDPTDNRTVTINGQDTTGTVTSETLQLTGETPVIGTITFRWLLSIAMSGPNATPVRRAYFRREDDVAGVWPQSKQLTGSTASGVSRFGGPFNLSPFQAPLMKGASAYYTATPTQESSTEPSSVHTYDSIEHLVVHDVYYSGGGIYFGYGENTPNTVWIFDPNNNAWGLPSPGTTTRPGGGTSCSVWDSTLNILWVRVSAGLYTYEYQTNTWTLRSTHNSPTTRSKLMIDTENRALYLVAPLSGTSVSIFKYDITNPAAVTVTPIVPTGTVDVRGAGSSPIEGLGAFFVSGRIALHGRDATGSRTGVYSINPNSPVWNIHEPDDGIKPPLYTPTGGVWGRFCTPDDIHILYIPTEADNVWAYRMPWSTATPFRPIGLQTVIR